MLQPNIRERLLTCSKATDKNVWTLVRMQQALLPFLMRFRMMGSVCSSTSACAALYDAFGPNNVITTCCHHVLAASGRGFEQARRPAHRCSMSSAASLRCDSRGMPYPQAGKQGKRRLISAHCGGAEHGQQQVTQRQQKLM